MTVFVPDSIKVLGSDASGASVVLCEMYVNTLAELPAPDKFEDFRLAMGCTATVINDNSRHRINSAGQWVQITAGTATYTKAEIDSMIARIDATEAEDRAALVAQVDGGAKNLLRITASSQTSKGVSFTVNDDQTVTVNGTNDGTGPSTFMIVPNAQAITIPDGNYILSGCPASGGGISTAPYDLRWYHYSQGLSAYDVGAGAKVSKYGNTTDSNIAVVVKSGVTVNNIMFKPMICTASDYAISPAFVPYAPTNRKLYELIKQYHP